MERILEEATENKESDELTWEDIMNGAANLDLSLGKGNQAEKDELWVGLLDLMLASNLAPRDFELPTDQDIEE